MRIKDKGIVFDASKANSNQRFSTFVSSHVLTDGRIMVVFRAGKSKDDPEENIMMRLSSDNGKSWATIFEGFESTVARIEGAWRAGSVTSISTSTLLGYFNWFDRSIPDQPLVNPETQGILPSRLFVMQSIDDGRTWINQREIKTGPLEGIALSGSILTLANGDLAFPFESWKAYDDHTHGQHKALLCVSKNKGQTFQPPNIVVHDSSNNICYWDERLAVCPETGKLIGLFWTYDRRINQDLNVHISWGTPDGQTWTPVEDTGLAGQIACPLILPGRKVLTFYVHRHDPPSLRVVLSKDFGKSWEQEDELVLYRSEGGKESGMEGGREFSEYWDDMGRWQFGHPDLSLLPNGDIFAAFYAGSAMELSVHWVLLSSVDCSRGIARQGLQTTESPSRLSIATKRKPRPAVESPA